MVEIESFNQLFTEAKLSGALLNNFCQVDSGAFRANWRKGGKFFDCVESPLPFVALRDSFLLVVGKASKAIAPADEDVFG